MIEIYDYMNRKYQLPIRHLGEFKKLNDNLVKSSKHVYQHGFTKFNKELESFKQYKISEQ